MATTRLHPDDIRAIATEVLRMMRLDQDEFVTTEEAAVILGVSPAWVRRTKNNYVHKQKPGAHGRLLFQRSSLIQSLEE